MGQQRSVSREVEAACRERLILLIADFSGQQFWNCAPTVAMRYAGVK